MSWSDLAIALLLSVPLLGCAPYFRPNRPLRTSSGPVTVDVRRVDLRSSDLEIALSDPRPGAALPPTQIDGAWIVATDAPDGAPCSRKAAAKRIQKHETSEVGAIYVARFDRRGLEGLVGNAPIDDNRLVDLLQKPSTLEVRVTSREEPPRCLSLPISGDAPELGWTLEPWGEDPLFVGKGLKFWSPVGASRYRNFAADLIVLRMGRWWGPLRIGAGAGIGLGGGASADPHGAYGIPGSIFAETFPLVGERWALGLVASYDVRPTFLHDGGFQLVHGPSAGLEVADLPVALPGFLKGPRAATVGLAATVGRWLPYGGATVVGFALTMN
jgi:hypothetical protein